MRVHHLNCGTLCPLSGPALVCHCLLVETESGLVLVDTGFGAADVRSPLARLHWSVYLMRPSFSPAETAVAQVRALGFEPEDVRHILLTHLDMDHAGGLADFPKARVHLFKPEYDAATASGMDFLSKRRYRKIQWAHGPDWRLYDVAGETWNGFEAVRELDGLPSGILLVPLVGHTRGHCAVAVETNPGWLLHAGDAYFNHAEMDAEHPGCPAGLALLQMTLAVDDGARRRNQLRLRELASARRDSVRVFCAHDRRELEGFR